MCSLTLHGLTYLHSEVFVIHRDVKSANVQLDRGCLGRIGDFHIARYLNDNHSGITSTYMHTEHAIGTQVYMVPVYHRGGELSTKVDTDWVCGLLTGSRSEQLAPNV